jgi:phosphoglycolate phosphatase-like HAD superfamily hydrolase
VFKRKKVREGKNNDVAQLTINLMRHFFYPERAAFKTLEEIEELGRRDFKLQPTLPELLRYLQQKNIVHSIVTRNNKAAVDHFKQTLGFDSFSHVITREHHLPVKPNPDASLHLCEGQSVENMKKKEEQNR